MKNKISLLAAILLLPAVAYSQVGIQTPNPQGTFHVDGAKDNPATGTPNDTQSSNDFIVSKNGNVGIGNISPSYKLDILSPVDNIIGLRLRGSFANPAIGQSILMSFNPNINGGGNAPWGIGAEYFNGIGSEGYADFIFKSASNNAYTNRMIIKNSGLVGINTVNPHSLLDLGTSLGKKLAIYDNANGGDFYGLGVEAQKLHFFVNSASSNGEMILRKFGSSGSAVGLGIGADPQYQLDLGSNLGKKLAVYSNGTDYYGFGVASGILQLYAGAGSMVLNTNGLVGIGTDTPNSKLDLGATVGDKKLAVYNNTSGTDFYGLGANNNNLMFHAGTNGGGAPGMVLNNTGNVGIGTTSPENRFHVVSSTPVSNRYTMIEAPAGGGLPILALRNTSPATANSFALLGFTNNGAAAGGATWGIGSVRNAANTLEDFYFGSSQGGGYNERMRITNGGAVGIGTTAPTSLLSVNGTADKPGGGSWGTFSDKRVKKDIADFKDGLNVITQLKTVTYKYNEKSGYKDLDKQYVGFIAQDVEKVAPYMVNIIDDTAKSGLKDKRELDESALTKILVNAVQEQQKEIEILKKEITELKGKKEM